MRLSQSKKKSVGIIYFSAAVFFLLAFFSGIMLGSTAISPTELFKVLFSGESESVAGRIILYVRLPRTLGALVCGAALAASGAVIQAVLANNLASPSLIGVNSGAGLAVTLAAVLGIYGGWKLSVFAFCGALAATLIVSLGAKKWGASRSTVILMGVALNSLLGALSDTLVTFNRDIVSMSNDFKIGDLSAVTYSKLLPALTVVVVCIGILMTLSNELDVLSLGEESARSLGLNSSLMRALFLIIAALMASAAVSVAGLVSFVGLLVPHAVRRLSGSKSAHLVPLCALFGGGFVALCDTLARVVFAPYEIPVGIIMAFLGSPFFIFILIKRRGGHKHDKT